MEKLIEQFSFGLFFWQLLLFIAVLLLLRKFAWKPILDAVEDRESGIKDALAAAENAKKEMQNVTADSERLLQEARVEREAMIKEAREMKEKIVADAKDLAQAEADKMIKQAQVAIESEKKAAVADIKNEVATLSLEIAEKVIKGQFSDKAKQMKLVEDMIGDIKLNQELEYERSQSSRTLRKSNIGSGGREQGYRSGGEGFSENSGYYFRQP